VQVPDERFDWLVDMHKPKSIVHPFLEIVDIAGLVKGASQGEGLGNAFLSHIAAVDGICHVMRAFEDKEILRDDEVDPVADIETIAAELRIKDIEKMDKRREALNKDKQRASGNPVSKKAWQEESDTVDKVLAWLNEGKDVRNGMEQWTTKDIAFLHDYLLLTAKPVLYLINLSENDYKRKKNKWLAKIHAWVTERGGGPMIPYSGCLEQKLQELGDEAEAYCKENEVTSALPKIIRTAFTTVNLIYFFTAGPDEVRGWCIRRGSTAPKAAGAIHTDFERGFICAEVMAFDVLKELGSEAEVKAKGKYRQEGKEYIVQDGDVIFFKFNVTAAKKK
jgi:obg-like ATPase 1